MFNFDKKTKNRNKWIYVYIDILSYEKIENRWVEFVKKNYVKTIMNMEIALKTEMFSSDFGTITKQFGKKYTKQYTKLFGIRFIYIPNSLVKAKKVVWYRCLV